MVEYIAKPDNCDIAYLGILFQLAKRAPEAALIRCFNEKILINLSLQLEEATWSLGDLKEVPSPCSPYGLCPWIFIYLIRRLPEDDLSKVFTKNSMLSLASAPTQGALHVKGHVDNIFFELSTRLGTERFVDLLEDGHGRAAFLALRKPSVVTPLSVDIESKCDESFDDTEVKSLVRRTAAPARDICSADRPAHFLHADLLERFPPEVVILRAQAGDYSTLTMLVENLHPTELPESFSPEAVATLAQAPHLSQSAKILHALATRTSGSKIPFYFTEQVIGYLLYGIGRDKDLKWTLREIIEKGSDFFLEEAFSPKNFDILIGEFKALHNPAECLAIFDALVSRFCWNKKVLRNLFISNTRVTDALVWGFETQDKERHLASFTEGLGYTCKQIVSSLKTHLA